MRETGGREAEGGEGTRREAHLESLAGLDVVLGRSARADVGVDARVRRAASDMVVLVAAPGRSKTGTGLDCRSPRARGVPREARARPRGRARGEGIRVRVRDAPVALLSVRERAPPPPRPLARAYGGRIFSRPLSVGTGDETPVGRQRAWSIRPRRGERPSAPEAEIANADWPAHVRPGKLARLARNEKRPSATPPLLVARRHTPKASFAIPETLATSRPTSVAAERMSGADACAPDADPALRAFLGHLLDADAEAPRVDDALLAHDFDETDVDLAGICAWLEDASAEPIADAEPASGDLDPLLSFPSLPKKRPRGEPPREDDPPREDARAPRLARERDPSTPPERAFGVDTATLFDVSSLIPATPSRDADDDADADAVRRGSDSGAASDFGLDSKSRDASASSADVDKREIRLRRNRASAAASRQRKRLETTGLRQKCRNLERALAHARYATQCAHAEIFALRRAPGIHPRSPRAFPSRRRAASSVGRRRGNRRVPREDEHVSSAGANAFAGVPARFPGRRPRRRRDRACSARARGHETPLAIHMPFDDDSRWNRSSDTESRVVRGGRNRKRYGRRRVAKDSSRCTSETSRRRERRFPFFAACRRARRGCARSQRRAAPRDAREGT